MMKKKSIVIAVSAIIMFMASVPAMAQEENGFKKFNVREDFTENGYTNIEKYINGIDPQGKTDWRNLGNNYDTLAANGLRRQRKK